VGEGVTRTIHTAAPPQGPVQRCARCDAVLIDRTGEMVLASTGGPPIWWSGNVAVGEGFAEETTEAATCVRRGH
jgi:hypothetical protein